jgi:excisionase family DNA binding protein
MSEDVAITTLRLVMPSIKEPLDVMLSVGEVAKRLGISSHTVHEEIRNGRLGSYRFGTRTIRVSFAQLTSYLTSREIRKQ